MNTLPVEIVSKVMRELDQSDLVAMRFVDRRYSTVATPLLFETLRFYGPDHVEWLRDRPHPKRAVEFGDLSEAIEEVLPVARACKKIIFGPAYRRQGFWDDYRAHVQAQIEEPVTQHDIEYPDEFYDGELDHDDLVQKVVDERLARPERERSMVLRLEKEWELKRQAQTANAETIPVALQTLLGQTKILEELEILPWEFSEIGDFGVPSYEMDLMHKDASPTVLFTHMLAAALEANQRHIARLHIHACVPELIQLSSSTQHLFSGLRSLRLDVYHVDSLLETSSLKQALPRLFGCALPTLERLELIGGGKWPQLPSRGVHTLKRILADEETGKCLCFPRLRFFRLWSLLVSTTSLLDFIAAQPVLSTLDFDNLYLATPGMGWPVLAARLPESINTWLVSGLCGHEPVAGFEPPISYNWCTDWNPRRTPLPAETGWKGEPMASPQRFSATQFSRVAAP